MHMVNKLLSYKPTQLILSTCIVLGALVCIFTPNYLLFKWGASFAVQIMFVYLLLALLFLVLNQSKLMLTSFACCAGLAFFLKHTTNSNLIPAARTSEDNVTVAHFNLSASADYESTIDAILASDSDILSLQEVTPDWNILLKDALKEYFPHSRTIVRIDPYGIAVYSKYPMQSLDTFSVNNIPNIIGSIRAKGVGKHVYFISSVTKPPFSSKTYEDLKQQFDKISYYVKTLKSPVLTIGDYNVVSWSNEIQHFREKSHLKDSRRGFLPSYPTGYFSFFSIPVDHIFYSPDLECTDFKTITSSSSEHLGIQGTFQFISNFSNVNSRTHSKF